MKAIPLNPELPRKRIRLFLVLHREMMVFFFIGYIVVTAAFIFKYSLVSETFVSFIFLSGAIFTYIGIVVQSQLLMEIPNPLQGILSICVGCKQVRIKGEDYKDSESWKGLDAYISEKTKVDFSHGYCPKCFDKEIKNIESGSGNA